MVGVDKYGRGSAAANGDGFVDLVPMDAIAALEEQFKRRKDLVPQTDCRQTQSTQRQMPISFIIPVYKTPLQLLRNCLDSVLKYSQPMELICVLDSPGDPCEAVLDEYAAKEPRMRVLKNDRNRGVSYSRNRGMDAATGDCLTFVDADDEIVATVYERQFLELRDRGTDAEIMATRREDGAAECERWGVLPGDGFVSSIKDGDGLEAKLVNVSWLSAYPIIFRRDALARSGARFIEGKRYGEDYVFVTQFLCSGAKVGYRNVCGYVSIGHPQSACQIGVSAKRCLDTIETAVLTCEMATEADVHKDALRIYLNRGMRMVLCDFSVRQMLASKEDRDRYKKWLSRFCRILNQNAPILSWATLSVVAAVRRFPGIIFLPCALIQNCIRAVGHFGWLLK